MDYKLVIVGTGFAGLGLAAKLREQGIEDFIILEKSDGVGGTWRGGWTVETAEGETYNCQFFVSAIGQLHHPATPKFKGKDSFAGPNFHSAEWDHSVDLAGKNIAVIGVGASAAQPQIGLLINMTALIHGWKNGSRVSSLLWPSFIAAVYGYRVSLLFGRQLKAVSGAGHSSAN